MYIIHKQIIKAKVSNYTMTLQKMKCVHKSKWKLTQKRRQSYYYDNDDDDDDGILHNFVNIK